jgi:hypothetical protein
MRFDELVWRDGFRTLMSSYRREMRAAEGWPLR